LALLAAAVTIPASAGTVFDSTAQDGLFLLGTPGRTWVGQPFTAADPGYPLKISSVTAWFAATQAMSFTDFVMSVQLWDSFNPFAASVFSSPVGSVQSQSYGALSVNAFEIYAATVVFAQPLALTGLSGHGVAINFQVNTGSGLTVTENVSVPGRATSAAGAFPVGTVPLPGPSYGYYRNASGRTDFNFASSDLYTAGSWSALAIELDAAVPEPATFFGVGGSVVGLLLVARARRRAR